MVACFACNLSGAIRWQDGTTPTWLPKIGMYIADIIVSSMYRTSPRRSATYSNLSTGTWLHPCSQVTTVLCKTYIWHSFRRLRGDRCRLAVIPLTLLILWERLKTMAPTKPTQRERECQSQFARRALTSRSLDAWRLSRSSVLVLMF